MKSLLFGVIQVRENLGRNQQLSISHVAAGDNTYREKQKSTSKYTVSEKKKKWYYSIKTSREIKENESFIYVKKQIVL